MFRATFSLNEQDVGRMKMELFADSVPKTAENVRWVGWKRRRAGEE